MITREEDEHSPRQVAVGGVHHVCVRSWERAGVSGMGNSGECDQAGGLDLAR